MHMSDALLSPEVGGIMWTVSGLSIAYCAKKVKKELDDRRIPLMGVMGAFVFAAQMINFTIPGTGSSGHLGGGLLLSIILGSNAAFIVMASVLTVQALFFADGGLLALGSNIFNLGFFPCFIAYPLIYRAIAGSRFSYGRLLTGSLFSVIVALQLGALFVVLETVFSGITELPFVSFITVMSPVHLAIGIVEGVVTALVISFLWKADPGIMNVQTGRIQSPARKVISGLILASVITGGVISWFSSDLPDGLEWSVSKVTGKESVKKPDKGIYNILSKVQKMLSFLPDYNFEKNRSDQNNSVKKSNHKEGTKTGTSVSGIIGGGAVIFIVSIIGLIIRKVRSLS